MVQHARPPTAPRTWCGTCATFGGKASYNWKVLLSGYAPQYAYELGGLDTRIPFEELRKRSYINPKARAIGDDPEFSRKIREGLPAPGR